MEDDIGISELYIVSTVPQEVAEEILGRAKEEINVFILLDREWIYLGSILGEGVSAGDVEMKGASQDGEVELVAADGELVTVQVLEVHLRWLLI